MTTNQEQMNYLSSPKKKMTRRQFLSYTLGATGAFMAAGISLPMIRFAVDPLLQKKGKGEFIKVAELSKITEEPQEFTFEKFQVDGWYESTPSFSAYITKDAKGQVYALSTVCQHLGCTIKWNGNKDLPEQYYCPCHGAHYTKDGKDLAVARGPLKEYQVKIENGWVYLGEIINNTRVT